MRFHLTASAAVAVLLAALADYHGPGPRHS